MTSCLLEVLKSLTNIMLREDAQGKIHIQYLTRTKEWIFIVVKGLEQQCVGAI